MAAAFFQGTLGQFASYSSFGNVGSQLGGQDQQAIAQGRQAAMSGGGYNAVAPRGQSDGGASSASQQATAGRGLNLGNENQLANTDAMKYGAPDRDRTT